jgi:hypothetical protein
VWPLPGSSPTQVHRLKATMILPGPHGCPCAHEDGYGHQTGRSFVRLPSSIGILEHMSQVGVRPGLGWSKEAVDGLSDAAQRDHWRTGGRSPPCKRSVRHVANEVTEADVPRMMVESLHRLASRSRRPASQRVDGSHFFPSCGGVACLNLGLILRGQTGGSSAPHG